MPLTAPAPDRQEGRRIIEQAYRDLERTICPIEHRNFAATTLQDVREAAKSVERQLAARQSLRNMRRLEPLFRGLEHYSKIFQVLCNGTMYLPWIWAPIKLILTISSDYIDAFERIMDAYTQIAESLQRFGILEQAFRDKPELYPTFATFYAEILTFHKATYQFVTQRCWKILFMVSWGRFQRKFKNILENLKRRAEIIDKEVNAHDIAEARKMRQDLTNWKASAALQLSQEEREQKARHVQGLITWLRLDDADQAMIQHSLEDTSKTYPGTVEWIIQHPKMTSWIRSNSMSQFLWLSGSPGTGKSVITARLARFLENLRDTVVVRHFCSSSQASSTTYSQILKAVILQCIMEDKELLAYAYEEHVGDKQPSITVLEKLLENAIDVISGNNWNSRTVYILIDGLDDCPQESQSRLYRLLRRLVTPKTDTQNTGCRVYVSSRDTSILRSRLKKQSRVLLSEEKDKLTEAIRVFSEARLREIHRKLEQLGISDSEMREVASQIADKSEGMFLWARLVLDYLSANFFYSQREFVEAVDTLPRELSAFYSKIISRILPDLDSRSASRLRGIFGWVAYSRRPIRKEEMQSLLLFHPDGDFDPLSVPSHTRPVPSYILDSCKPLVEERGDSTLRFHHNSIKEYLESEACAGPVRLQQQTILWEHGMASLKCLSAAFNVFSPLFDRETRDLQVLRGLWGFIPYASEFWCLDLQTMVSSPMEDWDSRFRSLAESLSAALSKASVGGQYGPENLACRSDQFRNLKSFQHLWYDANISLQAHLDRQRLCDDSKFMNELKTLARMYDILVNYELTIQRLVTNPHHTDFTAAEVTLFRDNFTKHAYPCRIPSCDYESKSRQERILHERTHKPSFPCCEPQCQNLLFTSKSLLNKHISELHRRATPKLKTKSKRDNTRDHSNSRAGKPQISSNQSNFEKCRSVIDSLGHQEVYVTRIEARIDDEFLKWIDVSRNWGLNATVALAEHELEKVRRNALELRQGLEEASDMCESFLPLADHHMGHTSKMTLFNPFLVFMVENIKDGDNTTDGEMESIVSILARKLISQRTKVITPVRERLEAAVQALESNLHNFQRAAGSSFPNPAIQPDVLPGFTFQNSPFDLPRQFGSSIPKTP